MRDRLDEFNSATVAVVTFAATTSQVAAHRQYLDVPFVFLSDSDRSLYRRFELGRGTVGKIWNLGSLLLYGRLLTKGRRLQRPTQDTRQLGGDFVIGPDRRLMAAFRPQSPGERPSINDLLQAVAD